MTLLGLLESSQGLGRGQKLQMEVLDGGFGTRNGQRATRGEGQGTKNIPTSTPNMYSVLTSEAEMDPASWFCPITWQGRARIFESQNRP